MIYQPKKEETNCFCNLGNFLSLPILGLGDNQGYVKLVAIAQGTKSREMVIGSWKVSSSDPIKQLERLDDQNVLASLDSKKVKIWNYSLSDDGLKEDLMYSLDQSSFNTGNTKGTPIVLEWINPRHELAVSFNDDSAIRLFDINKGAASRSFALEDRPNRLIEETCAER